MQKRAWIAALVLIASSLGVGYINYAPFAQGRSPSQQTSPAGASEDNVSCSFSPAGGCTEAVVRELNAARDSILMQAYSFTSTPIAKALVEAQQRGVKITVILDKSQRTEKYSSADFVQHAGIPTYIDAQHAIAHNKIMLIDGRTIITGSFNFTKAAEEHNAENLLVIHDKPTLYAAYEANFQHHLDHSEPYQGHEDGGERAALRPASPSHSRSEHRKR